MQCEEFFKNYTSLYSYTQIYIYKNLCTLCNIYVHIFLKYIHSIEWLTKLTVTIFRTTKNVFLKCILNLTTSINK